MTSIVRKDLEPIVVRAEAEILKLVREIVPNARLSRIGPLDINGPSWSCWIITTTDKERDKIAKDRDLLGRLHKVAADAGFAPDSFTVQSDETVKRKYAGSWFYAMR